MALRILTLDVGTSAVKAARWHAGRCGPVVRIPVANIRVGERAEVPAARLLRTVESAARAAADGEPVDAVCVATFSSSVVVCDRRGGVRAGVITHADRRSTREARRIEERVGRKRILQITGNVPVPGGIGSSTLCWLHAAGALRRTDRVGQASTYLLHQWTGAWTIDPSQAAFLGLLDIRRGGWSDEVCAACGVSEDALPTLTPADQVLGHLTPAAARRLGLRAGTPVIGGLVDTSAAVIAAGLELGQLVHNAGSTDVLALVVDQPRPAPHRLTRPLGTGATLPARWLAVSTIAAAGSTIDWARQTFFADLTPARFAAVLRAACTGAPHGVAFAPYLAGDRTAVQQRRAEITGLTLASDREAILAAIVRALAQESATRFADLARLRRVAPVVRTMGGGAVLAEAMHRAWPRGQRRRFVPIAGEGLAGLQLLAGAVLGAHPANERALFREAAARG